MRYSETTGCFYPESINYGNKLPNDIVNVPDSDFELAVSRPLKSTFKLSNGRIVIDPESEQKAKIDALQVSLSVVDDEVRLADSTPFPFNGHTFYPDTEFIQGMFSVLPYLQSDYSERWKTAEKSGDGINNVYVTLDKAGIQGLALAYIQFKKNNWLSGEAKKQILKDAFLAGE